MVRFINEIILKYLLGISKCTKLPGKKQKRKKQKTKQYLGTNTSLHIRHIYISEIILATFSLKSLLLSLFFFLEKKFPSSVLNSTAVGFWTGPTLRYDTRHMRFSDFLIDREKINISKVNPFIAYPQ